MEREQPKGRFEGLKQHSVPDRLLGEIDITERVMSRISALPAKGQQRSRWSLLRLSFPATALLVVLLASATVYAASEYIQIRDRAGEVKLESRILVTEGKIVKPPTGNAAQEPTYRDRVLASVKPGQLLSYYVKENASKMSIMFLYDTNVYSSYNEFAELADRSSAPVIKEPQDLPAGLAFSYGNVTPILPNEYDARTSAEYDRLQKLFQKRVDAEPDRKLFIEEAEWTTAERSELVYENGEMTLHIAAMKSVIRMEAAYTAGYTQDKFNVGGVDIILAVRSKDGIRYEAVWYDERQDIHYKISASGNVQLTEKQFKRIVENMVGA